jgi:hypothetical protein
MSFFSHPESQVAWEMRQPGGPREATMVVDNTPCGSRSFDQARFDSCEAMLPGMIPRGSTLTIWATVDGGQTFHRRVIEGTGSLIA